MRIPTPHFSICLTAFFRISQGEELQSGSFTMHHLTEQSIHCSLSKGPSHVNWWSESNWVNIEQLRVIALLATSIQHKLNHGKSHNFSRMHGMKACSSPHNNVSIQIRRRKDLQVCFLSESLQNRRKRRNIRLIEQLSDRGILCIRHAEPV